MKKTKKKRKLSAATRRRRKEELKAEREQNLRMKASREKFFQAFAEGFANTLGSELAREMRSLYPVDDSRFIEIRRRVRAARKLLEDLANRIDASGLMPILGQPGLFRDESTDQTVNIRDFREGDKYDTIVIPPSYLKVGSKVSKRLRSKVYKQKLSDVLPKKKRGKTTE